MVFGTMLLSADPYQIKFSNFPIFFSQFFLFESLQLGKRWFSSLMRIPLGTFWRCKIDKF